MKFTQQHYSVTYRLIARKKKKKTPRHVNSKILSTGQWPEKKKNMTEAMYKVKFSS